MRWLVSTLLIASAATALAQSTTPTATASPPVPFGVGNVVILRLGDATHNATAAAVGMPMPVYLDELTPAGALVRTLPLPTSTCALASGKPTAAPFWWYDTDGWPQLSDNGQVRRGWAPGHCCTRRAYRGQCLHTASKPLAPPPRPQYIMFVCMAPASLTVAMPDTTATVKKITTVSYAGALARPARVRTSTTQRGPDNPMLQAMLPRGRVAPDRCVRICRTRDARITKGHASIPHHSRRREESRCHPS